jgi:hypothetical protein
VNTYYRYPTTVDLASFFPASFHQYIVVFCIMTILRFYACFISTIYPTLIECIMYIFGHGRGDIYQYNHFTVCSLVMVFFVRKETNHLFFFLYFRIGTFHFLFGSLGTSFSLGHTRLELLGDLLQFTGNLSSVLSELG